MLQCKSTRAPLRWRAIEPPALDALAPKFQENYKMKKDGHKVMSFFLVYAGRYQVAAVAGKYEVSAMRTQSAGG